MTSNRARTGARLVSLHVPNTLWRVSRRPLR